MEQKNIFVIYRDNELFSKTIPWVVETLETEGHAVEVHAFPKGTPEEEIGAWALANAERLVGKALVCDATFSRSARSNGEARGKIEKFGIKLYNRMYGSVERKLDNCYAGAAVSLLFPKAPEGRRREAETSAFKAAFVEVFKRMLTQHQPKQVFISMKIIGGHDPFNYGMYDGRYSRETNDENGDAARDLIACLEEAGVHRDCIHTVGMLEILPPAAREPDSWVLYDRHEDDVLSPSATAFRIPLENLIEDATRAGVIDITPKEFQETLVAEVRQQSKYWK